MAADSYYYTNKLYNFRQGPEKIRGPGVGLRIPSKISVGGPALTH